MNQPKFRVVTTPLPGAPYTVSAIYVATENGDQLVHSQLGPYGDGEAEERTRDFFRPQLKYAPRAFSNHGKNISGGRKPKAATEDDDED
jgi:hypothetical protein